MSNDRLNENVRQTEYIGNKALSRRHFELVDDYNKSVSVFMLSPL